MQEEWINFRPKLHSVPVIWYAAREMKSFAKAANLSTAWGLIKWKLPAHVQWLPDSEFHRDVSLLCLDLLVVKGWWQTTQHITWIPWMHVTRPLYAPVDNKQKPQIRVSQAVIILLSLPQSLVYKPEKMREWAVETIPASLPIWTVPMIYSEMWRIYEQLVLK